VSEHSSKNLHMVFCLAVSEKEGSTLSFPLMYIRLVIEKSWDSELRKYCGGSSERIAPASRQQ
jgi:hypothetical protein